MGVAEEEDVRPCGAGGGQIFMDRPARLNVIRLKELRDTAAATAVSSCPHCMTMLTSAAAQTKSDTPFAIRDIAEIVADRLPDSQR